MTKARFGGIQRSRVLLLGAIALLFIAATAFAAAPTTTWVRQFGTVTSEESKGIAVDGSGNIYVTGATSGSLGGAFQGQADVFIAKYSASGVQQWVIQFGTADDDQGWGISVDDSDGVYVTGFTKSSLYSNAYNGLSDAFIAKFNSSGVQQWISQFGTNRYEYGTGVAVDSDGNVYVTGYTDGSLYVANPDMNNNAFLAKFDASGAELWGRQFGPSTTLTVANGVAVESGGSTYVTGYTFGAISGVNFQGSGNVFIRMYNAAGDVQWTRQFGSTGTGTLYDYGRGIAPDGNGGVYVTGDTKDALGGDPAGLEDIFIVKYNASGTEQWKKQFGTQKSDYGRSIFANNGGVYVTGETYGFFNGANKGGSDVFIIALNAGGAEQWRTQFGTAGYDKGCGAAVDVNGNVYVTGHTDDALGGQEHVGNYDVFIAAFGQSSTTPTPTPTPVECTANDISVSPFSLTLKRKKKVKNAITVTVSGEDDCKVVGEKIIARVDSAGKKLFSVTPASRKTKEDGTSVFSIKAKSKAGNATVTFSTSSGLSESLNVTVTK